jgi:hypothetical protein
MWHSLEHAPDPHTAIQNAKFWLKSDGILVVDVLNYEGTDAQESGTNGTAGLCRTIIGILPLVA